MEVRHHPRAPGLASKPAPGRGNVRCLEYAGCRIAVRAAEPATLDWLEEFLYPAFEPDLCERPDWTVSLDAGRRQSIENVRHSASGEMLDGFSLDGCFRRLEVIARVGGRLTLRNEKSGILFLVDRDGSSVRIVTNTTRRQRRLALMRVVRELATAHALRHGCLPVHGAAFHQHGGAIVLAGAKRSGKTSLLIHALSRTQATFVSNDRLFLRLSNDAPLVRAMPTIFKIRPQTLKLQPLLRRRYRARPYDREETIEESRTRFNRRGADRFGPTEPEPRLTATQFCDLLGVDAAGETRLSAIVFPRITTDVATVAFERLAPAAAAARLLDEGLMKASSPQRTAEAFRAPGDVGTVDEAAQRDLCERIVTRVPCYSCALGPSAYEVPFSLEEVFRKAG